MKVRFLLFFAILLAVSGFAQHKLTTYSAHKSITNAIRINNELIIGRTVFFEKQSEEKPLMFQNTKMKIAKVNWFSNNLSKYIETLQKEINTEEILYDMLKDGIYKKELFNNNHTLTIKGEKLKSKIDDLYKIAAEANVHKLSQLENFYKANFKTDAVFYGFDENELNYFQYYFSDTSNYGIMMSLNCLLLDVKTFQLLYYGTVMSY